jgi:hypothetical protein
MTTPRLRISHVVAQPVLVWDDGEELTPGPPIEAITMPLSKLAALADTLPAEVAALEAHLLQESEAKGQ